MESRYDIVIVGGGAAGLTAAQYAARANRSVLVFEGLTWGGQCSQIEGLENYPRFPQPITNKLFNQSLIKVLILPVFLIINMPDSI